MTGLPEPSAEAVEALAPTGTLRAGINLSNFLLVTGRSDTGDPIGVSPDLAAALADNLGVPLTLVPFKSPGELADAAVGDVWDIGNIGADPARSEHIAFAPPYSEIESTYLVRGDSPITSLDEVDQPGVRIVTKARAAYSLWLERHIARAELIQVAGRVNPFDTFVDDGIDALAGLRPGLLTDQEKLPGSRILDGRFATVQQAIGTPRDRPAAGVEHLERFVQAVIETGVVAELIERHGVAGRLQVAGQ